MSSNNVASTSTAPSATTPAAAVATTQDAHFDKSTGKWTYEDAAGQEHEWDEGKNAWVPVAGEDLVAAQQQAYSVAGVDETAAPLTRRDKKRKKKEDAANAEEPKAKREKPAPRNTAVYVTQLPLERLPTIDEMREVFSKAGVVLEHPDGTPKIKLYTDATTGRPNGEALVVYLNEASVELAVRLLDETELRLGEAARDGVMKVQAASFEHKKTTDDADGDKRPKKSEQEKAKAAKTAEKLRSKVQDWDESDDEDTVAAAARRFNRIVVLARMFSLAELESDPALLLDLKEDVREECEALGKVTNVTLYDKEPDGVMTIKFADPVAAQACIAKMNGRFFAGRQVIAGLYDGKRRFRKTGKTGDLAEDDADEKARLESFAKYLEEE